MSYDLTPSLVLNAYARGIFPMAESRDDDDIYWLEPEQRGILPLDGFHISRSLRKTLQREPYQIKIDTNFVGVVEGCADRSETWINDTIFAIYMDLFRAGHAHCIEVWDKEDLVGGVYGVCLRAAFFGESMFSRRRDASKIALAYLVSRLRFGGFQLFDMQFLTSHLASLGGIEVSRDAYRKKLKAALQADGNFLRQPQAVSAHQVCNE
ncbi:leucyl/phenylalanyl-tRNA--protein transferase [Litoreibacter roseus]|uniref:Leucyl/phenylalanyl-tRNA--protein transferase n=1 Tax=Litoreibacter roseus TaxID=2601869 RepID=A0A6N6JJW7_9RHOB|nr:leucyl/phenylalanyl-tRNA--protein transferase [Litoreibacter roseus]GFE66150.1 leucyl/phenylalanyl-tRNA--protein transferase [Litoreibacter roseus]